MKFTVLTKVLMLLMCVYDGYCQEQELTVNIPTLGRVRGSKLFSTSGRAFQAFRGIPFAQPPVGDLRFADPLPAKSWGKEILDATKEGPSCTQFDMILKLPMGQEDCLVLNVYTPSRNYAEDALPVMVWIHGGGWIAGSGNGETHFYGPGYILDRDVVLVTINYRLGPFGFLSTEDAIAPGNYGLLDQSLALKWVQEHITNFGGNPHSVTIFGESAGGAAVEFQLFSPRSKGLFHRAIAQSGSTRCPWSLQFDVGEYTRELAEILNCTTSSSQELLDCLRTKDGNDILNTRTRIMKPTGHGIFPIAFGPRVDSERDSPFLPDDPVRLVSRKEFNSVPLIAGVTENEGGYYAARLASVDGAVLKAFNIDPIASVRYVLAMEKREKGHEIAKKVHQHYFASNKNKETYEQYGELFSDFGFFKCVDESVNYLSQFSEENVYYYNYAHQGQFSLAKMVKAPAEIDFGVAHGDDIFLLFNNKMLPELSEPKDLLVSKILLDLWTSFASNGIPQSDDMPDSWLPVKDGKTRYLKIQSPNPTMIEGPMPFKSKLDNCGRLLSSSSSKTEL